jgi:hypothetical protein
MGLCHNPHTLPNLVPLALEAAFDGGRITSNGGLVWLAQADRELTDEEVEIHS